jgi:hypothetical protein
MPQTKEEINQKKREYMKEYRKKHKEQKKEYMKAYCDKHKEQKKEYDKKYYQTPQGKKTTTLSDWRQSGLLETKEKLEELYEIYTTIKLCEACDIELTRSGKNCSTDICLDHCHTTGRFRLMLCRSCNTQDRWKQYFC